MEYVWLGVAALLAGAINAVAGGGTLLTFPALEALVGPIFANGTSTVSLMPGSAASAWGYRKEFSESLGWLALLAIPSVVGGAIGTLLVTLMEEKYFKAAVPWLILLAATLFLLQPAIARRFAVAKVLGDDAKSPAQLGAKTKLAIFLGQLAIGVYGGYFGAGIGILMLSSLSFLGLKSIHEVNALKSALAFCINLVAAFVFLLSNKIDWRYGIYMGAMAIVGGYLGAKLSLRVKPAWIRIVVVCIGFGLSAYYLAKQWAPVFWPSPTE